MDSCYRIFLFSQWKCLTVLRCKNILCPRSRVSFFPPSEPQSTGTFAGCSRVQGFLWQGSVGISTAQHLCVQPLPFFVPCCAEAKPLLHTENRQAHSCEQNPAFLPQGHSFLRDISLEKKKNKLHLGSAGALEVPHKHFLICWKLPREMGLVTRHPHHLQS